MPNIGLYAAKQSVEIIKIQYIQYINGWYKSFPSMVVVYDIGFATLLLSNSYCPILLCGILSNTSIQYIVLVTTLLLSSYYIGHLTIVHY